MESTTADKLQDIRKRILAGEPYTDIELREAIQLITGDRMTQLEKATTKTKKIPAQKVDLSDLL